MVFSYEMNSLMQIILVQYKLYMYLSGVIPKL